MTNDLKNFLEKQVRKFCGEEDDSMFPVELDKSYTEVVNFILDLVEKEVEKCNTDEVIGEGLIKTHFGLCRKIDIKTIINKLRV